VQTVTYADDNPNSNPVRWIICIRV